MFQGFKRFGAKRHKLNPIRPVQRPVLDCLRDVLALNLRAGFHVGDRPRDLQYPVMRPCTESLLLHGALEHALAVSTQVAVGADLA
jgi:hypothetical protein